MVSRHPLCSRCHLPIPCGFGLCCVGAVLCFGSWCCTYASFFFVHVGVVRWFHQEWPRQAKPKKGQCTNFSQGHSGMWILLVFLRRNTRIHKNGRNSWTFVLALSLVWFAGATPDSREKILTPPLPLLWPPSIFRREGASYLFWSEAPHGRNLIRTPPPLHTPLTPRRVFQGWGVGENLHLQWCLTLVMVNPLFLCESGIEAVPSEFLVAAVFSFIVFSLGEGWVFLAFLEPVVLNWCCHPVWSVVVPKF